MLEPLYEKSGYNHYAVRRVTTNRHTQSKFRTTRQSVQPQQVQTNARQRDHKNSPWWNHTPSFTPHTHKHTEGDVSVAMLSWHYALTSLWTSCLLTHVQPKSSVHKSHKTSSKHSEACFNPQIFRHITFIQIWKHLWPNMQQPRVKTFKTWKHLPHAEKLKTIFPFSGCGRFLGYRQPMKGDMDNTWSRIDNSAEELSSCRMDAV